MTTELWHSNPSAARSSGINRNTLLLRTYLLAGLMATITDIVFLTRANPAKPDYGESYLLLTVLVAIAVVTCSSGATVPTGP